VRDKLKMRHYGSPVLRRKAEPVTVFDDALLDFIEGMIDTLYEQNGVGLAAPQVGVSKRVVIIDISFGEEENEIIALVNPEILSSEGECAMEEGCLSIPKVWEEVTRPERIRVRYQDAEGNVHEDDAEGMLARVVQHEVDHLEGILFVDRLGTVKKTFLARALRDIAEREDSEE
jgi:peptide deformylase